MTINLKISDNLTEILEKDSCFKHEYCKDQLIKLVVKRLIHEYLPNSGIKVESKWVLNQQPNY